MKVITLTKVIKFAELFRSVVLKNVFCNFLQDFMEAIAKCNKSVSKEDLDKYEKWMEEFGSS